MMNHKIFARELIFQEVKNIILEFIYFSLDLLQVREELAKRLVKIKSLSLGY